MLGGAFAQGAQVQRLSVTRKGDAYAVVMRAQLAAPSGRVWAALTDLRGLGELTPAFKEVEILGSGAPGTNRVRTLTHLCLLIFCRDIAQVQDFTRVAHGWLHAQVDPTASELREGEADWHLVPSGDGTLLLFETHFVPDFWVPPLIGPWAVKRALVREAQTVTANLERIATEKPCAKMTACVHRVSAKATLRLKGP